MSVTFAVIAIISLAFCFFAFNVAREPKKWRLYWLDVLGILDVDSTREQRRSQERQIAVMSYLVFVCSMAACASCIFWTVDQVREQLREKTSAELDAEFNKRQIEEIGRIPRNRSAN